MKPKYAQVQLVRPPIAVSRSPARNLFQLTSDKRALTRCTGMVRGCIMKRVIFHKRRFLFVDAEGIEVFPYSGIDSFDVR
jgi:hypothetical protein